MTDPAVRLTGLYRTYDENGLAVRAVNGIDLEIPRKRFSMIVGPSGSGKTTLLNLIGCIDRPTGGTVEVCGRDVAALSDGELSDFRAKQIGFIFQNFSLIPVLSAFENIEYGLLLLEMSAAERRRLTQDVIERVGLTPVQDHRPNQLSGGQKQRVAIARALVKRPEIILADEPTANLDSETGSQVIALMRSMQAEFHTTFIFSTHDLQLISEADETFRIRDGQLVDAISREVQA